MASAYLEHGNVTVADPRKIADTLVRLFDWTIRWSGPSLDDGTTVHVGNSTSYLALYSHQNLRKKEDANHFSPGKLNHLGIVVDDLNEVEARVKQENLEPFSFRDYSPSPGGKRFYVNIDDELEIEVISYQ